MRVKASGGGWDLGVRVWLDGVEVSHDCTEADDQAGTVTLLVRDAKGRAQLSPDADDRPWTVTRRGAVVIRMGGGE